MNLILLNIKAYTVRFTPGIENAEIEQRCSRDVLQLKRWKITKRSDMM